MNCCAKSVLYNSLNGILYATVSIVSLLLSGVLHDKVTVFGAQYLKYFDFF